MTANISLLGDKKSNILTIPIRCIFSDDNGNDVVYVIRKGKQPLKTLVKTGINDLQNVEIIDGLKDKDVISGSDPDAAKSTTNVSFN